MPVNILARVTGRLLKIGEVAEQTGLSMRTVRYYEQMGLITPEARSDGGFRLYSQAQVHRLGLIMGMKPLGFHIDQMRELLLARDALQDDTTSRSDRQGASEILARYAQDAKRRLVKLRNQLEHAKRLSQQLDQEATQLP